VSIEVSETIDIGLHATQKYPWEDSTCTKKLMGYALHIQGMKLSQRAVGVKDDESACSVQEGSDQVTSKSAVASSTDRSV
jgi:hypothetical protein